MTTLTPQKNTALQLNIVLSLILLATLTRIAMSPLFGHLVNFSPIDAIALLSGAYFSRYLTAVSITLLSVWVGDIFLNRLFLGHWELFYSGFYWQYGAYALITCLGFMLAKNVKPLRLLSTCFLSSILFFAVSNFGVWMSGLLYPRTMDGLMMCYTAALPFFKNTVFSDLFFSIILFTSFKLIEFNFSLKNKALPINHTQ